MNTQNSITKTDLIRIEESIKKLLKAAEEKPVDEEYMQLMRQLTNSISELKLIVEFDHEKRLTAIEEFLQQL